MMLDNCYKHRDGKRLCHMPGDGKPHIGELGYAFLFRNYRPEQGKWQTADPLGYPDGWNNLAYVNNNIIENIDWLGYSAVSTSGTASGPGGVNFTITAYGWCNDDYNSPSISSVSAVATGITSVTVKIDFSFLGFQFPVGSTVSIENVNVLNVGGLIVIRETEVVGFKSLSTNNLTFFAQYAILPTHNLCEVKYGTSETKNLGNHR